MDRYTTRFANCEQTCDDLVISTGSLGNHLAPEICRDTAHVVVYGRQNRDRFLGHVDALVFGLALSLAAFVA